MEKETLEELYLNQLINEISRGFLLDKKTAKEVAIKYSKWQQEQMYSEEDMLLAFETGRNFQLTGENNFKELIEQLKK
jgi:ribosomal protein S4E